jgi:RHS repeat-associated protein
VQKQFFRFICLFLLLFQFAVLANSSSSCDHLGTPKELYNAQGECVWQAQHSLWGKLSLVKSKSYNPTQAVIEQNAGSNDYKEDLDFQLPNHSCELRFAGQWFDAESGLHYNYNRYYDPNSGQYLSQDPIGLAGGFRTQAYVADPVHWVDPLGLAPCVGNAAGKNVTQLPQLKGKTPTEIGKILTENGYTRRNPANIKNERWVHPDGSEVQIHKYGSPSVHKSGDNAHVHKDFGKHGEGTPINDRGHVDLNPDNTHIGIPNRPDHRAVRGLP